MLQSVHRRPRLRRGARLEAPSSPLPSWLVPLGGALALVLVVALSIVSCQGMRQDYSGARVDDGVRTPEEAVKAGGVAADGGPDVKTAFAAYSWDDLSRIAQEIAACQEEGDAADLARKYRLVDDEGRLTGDCKPLTWSDGSPGAVQIAGFHHDDKSDGSGKAGISFIVRDTLPQKQCMNLSGNNDGGWELSDMRAYLQAEGIGWLPAEVSEKIVSVNKATNNIGLTQDASAVTQTSDDVWLYSKAELCGETAYPGYLPLFNDLLKSEGRQYQLFSDGGVADKELNHLLEKSDAEGACVWWTRSSTPDLNSGNGYFIVLKAGETDDFSRNPSKDYGVVLGFCF